MRVRKTVFEYSTKLVRRVDKKTKIGSFAWEILSHKTYYEVLKTFFLVIQVFILVFKEMKVNTARSVEEHFTYLTDMNGYLGEMTINHDDETINIRVVRRKGNDKSTANQEVRSKKTIF